MAVILRAVASGVRKRSRRFFGFCIIGVLAKLSWVLAFDVNAGQFCKNLVFLVLDNPPCCGRRTYEIRR